jgi:hypothetical protein
MQFPENPLPLPGEPQQIRSRMNQADTARCQQAIELANSGQKPLAYQIFCDLYNTNPQDTTLLTWIAFTTPRIDEAQRAIADIARLEPDHPNLGMLQSRVSAMRHRLSTQYYEPVMTCPYCHYTGTRRFSQKISTGGWVTFVVLLLVFFPICWIGLLMKENQYVCGRCGMVLGDIAY